MLLVFEFTLNSVDSEGAMPERDDPIGRILGVSPLAGERRRAGPEGRSLSPRPKKPGNDSVSISSRARRLADIETFLAEDDAGQGADTGEET